MNTSAVRRNERWSAIETTTSKKSSSRLRQILINQDFGQGHNISRLDSSTHTMAMPAVRAASVNSMGSLGSMSSISSMGSFGSTSSSCRFISRKSSNSKLLRYHNRDSKNSLLSMNTRWKSTPPQKRKSTRSSSNTILNVSILRPTSNGNHQGRWMATVSSDSAIDRPIGAIQRKASANAFFPSSAWWSFTRYERMYTR